MARSRGENKTNEYSLKLKTVGLDSDPYDLPKNQWTTTDVSIWPDIDFGDIYMYLISSPGKYTQQSLKAWKSLDAWAFFKAGFVGEIKVTRTPKDILVVCGQVCAFTFSMLTLQEKYNVALAALQWQ